MRAYLLTCLTFIALAAGAWAHPNLQNTMWIQFEPQAVHMAVNVSLKEIFVAQGIALTEKTDPDAQSRALEKHGTYLLSHLALTAGDSALPGKIIQITPPPTFTDQELCFVQYEIEYALSGPPPAEIKFQHRMLEEWPYAIGAAWDLSYVVRTKRPDSNAVSSWLLRYQQPTTIATGWQSAAPLSSADGWRAFFEYLWHGVMHILTGYDHLLFVTALIIATLNFWEMVKVIAAFTLAHTITLGLSVFDIFRLPSYIVEPVIAASIVFVALENVLWPQRAQSRMRLLVAFGFGLVHGLGFAGGLLEAMSGMSAIGIWIALAGFSLGVEIGHQIVVLPLFGLLGLSRRRFGIPQAWLRYGSATISCCGVYYLAVAIHEQFSTR